MRALVGAVVLSLCSHVLAAPPGLTTPSVQPSDTDLQLIDEGDIGGDAIAGGVLTSLVLGFGLGQAIEGRWHDSGRWYALAEGVSAGMFTTGAIIGIGCDYNCTYGELVFGVGLLSLMGLRVAEIVDASVGPARHNNRVQAARVRAGLPEHAAHLMPLVLPTPRGDGAMAGIAVRF